jgi:hypothetical protein
MGGSGCKPVWLGLQVENDLVVTAQYLILVIYKENKIIS